MTKFEVISKLEPLTKSVVAYTDTDYTKSGLSPSSPQVLNAAKSNFDAIQRQEDVWREYAAGISSSPAGIPGLDVAITNYNEGLDAWQANQRRAIANWEKCLTEGGGDLSVATCMLNGYSIEDEQKALAMYTTPLKALLGALGVSM